MYNLTATPEKKCFYKKDKLPMPDKDINDFQLIRPKILCTDQNIAGYCEISGKLEADIFKQAYIQKNMISIAR